MANIVRRHENQGSPWDPFRVMREMMRWDPYRELSPATGQRGGELFEPPFEVRETQDAFLVEADLPGIKNEDLQVMLTGNRLQISGHRETKHTSDSDTFYAYERSYGSFTRTFTLPENVDVNQISSDLKDGVLTVVLPKRPETQPKRIAIGAGKSRS
jgi:HSP20 family protein